MDDYPVISDVPRGEWRSGHPIFKKYHPRDLTENVLNYILSFTSIF